MNDDLDPRLDAVLNETFAAHGRKVGPAGGRIDDVMGRVARRRTKRRTLAGIGSLAVVAAGIGGIVAVGQIDRAGTARGAGDGSPIETPRVDDGSWFVCTGPYDERQYRWCDLETPYVNPVWECAGVVDGPSFGDDERPRFEECGAVGERNDSSECVPIVATPTGSIPVGPVTGPPPSAPPTTWFDVTCAAEQPLASYPALPSYPVDTAPATSVPASTDVLSTATTVVATTTPDSAPYVPTTAEACPPACDARSPIEQRHIVAPGDSLQSIADLYGITLEQLVAYNQFPDGVDHVLTPGGELMIRPDALLAPGVCLHIVEVGDNPDRVAERYDTEVEAIALMNVANDRFARFHVGDVIFVPRSAGC